MKQISEKELHAEFGLSESSKAALVCLIGGCIGVLCCIVIFAYYQYLISQTAPLLESYLTDGELGPDQKEAIQEKILELTLSFNNVVIPFFLVANIAWVIGAVAWSKDIGKYIPNRLVRQIGGMFVFAAAVICGFWWYLLLTRFGTA